MTTPRPDHGTDDPARLLALIGLTIVALLVGLFLTGGGQRAVAVIPLVVASSLGTVAFLRARSSSLAKPRLWSALLDELELGGDEQALDVGCGRGLVLCGLARRLPAGRVVGVDLWRSADQSGNHPDATRANARLLRVEDRVEVRTGDARALDLEDASFDVVTAGLVLGHLTAADRQGAVDELVRVLRPGGQLVIVDHGSLVDVENALHDHPVDGIRRWENRSTQPYPRLRVITATRRTERTT